MPLGHTDPIPVDSPDITSDHLADLNASYPEIIGGEWEAPRNALYLDDLRAYYQYDTDPFDPINANIVDANAVDNTPSS